MAAVRARDFGNAVRTDFAPRPISELHHSLDSLRVEFLEIPPESPLVGRLLRNAGIRESTGALVLAVVRDGHMIHAPDAGFVFEKMDTILVAGAVEQVAQVEEIINGAVRT